MTSPELLSLSLRILSQARGSPEVLQTSPEVLWTSTEVAGPPQRSAQDPWEAWHSLSNWANVSETPTPTTCLKSTAVHLQFVRQYAPHLYRRAFLASKLRRKGNPAIRLPFVLEYASHLYGSTPPICTAVLLEKYWGLGSPERF